MGMSWADAAEWDFVENSKALEVWNDRHETEDEPVDPPSLEWMMERDSKLADKGYRVN